MPIHLFKGIQKLNIDELEEALKRDYLKYDIQNLDGILFKPRRKNGIFVDLSQVRFVTLSAAVQVTLLIEKIIRLGIQVYIALPTNRLTEKEASSDMPDDLKNLLQENRSKANNFLKNIGFDRAVQCDHIVSPYEVLMTESFEFESEATPLAFDNAFSQSISPREFSERGEYQYLYPLEWINCESDGGSGLEEFEKKFTKLLQSPERGLDTIDVQGIKNVILSELTKNVKEHAYKGREVRYGLLAIGLIDVKSLFRKDTNDKLITSNAIESEYINWLIKENIGSQVEIYFGDSGSGILSNNISNAYYKHFQVKGSHFDQLKWTFEKWSTSKQDEEVRGTKGLYRISRIVDKYNGLCHIRTANLNGGYQKGGYQKSTWIQKDNLSNIPGTFIQIKLCPYVEVVRFNFTLKDVAQKRKWKSIHTEFNIDEELTIQIERFEKKLNEPITNGNFNHLHILDFPENQNISQRILESILPKISHYSHPIGCVVYLNTSLQNDTIETIVQSTNSLLFDGMSNPFFPEIEHEEFEDVHDPIIVVGKNDKVFWFGGSRELIHILNEASSKKNKAVDLKHLPSYTNLNRTLRDKVRLHFNSDNSLVYIDNEGNLSFSFLDISNLYENEIKELYQADSVTSTPKYTICSPKLELIDKWFDIKKLINENESGFAFALFLKLKSEAQKEISDLNKLQTFILIDHNQQKYLAHKFADLIGVNARNIINASLDVDVSIPKRTKLFKKGDQVIILTTLVSSSETIRRLVKYVKRDEAKPLFILCLGNGRSRNIKELETWDETTKIISLYQKNPIEIEVEDTSKSLEFAIKKVDGLVQATNWVQPDYTTITSRKDAKSIISGADIDDSLAKHLLQTKSMHYNHVGIYGKRHFTFYINKDLILSDASPIRDKLKKSINLWNEKRKLKKNFTIVLNESLVPSKGNNDFFNFLTQEVSSSVGSIQNGAWKNFDNIVFLDFGSISGESVRNFVSGLQRPPKELLICIMFNQSTDESFKFLERVKLLRGPNDDKYEFGDSQDGSATQELPLNQKTRVVVEKLFDLPLQYYSSQSCPICEHNRALDTYSVNQDYLLKFAQDRQNRLRIRERDDIHQSEYPFDFYQDKHSLDNELSAVVISKMFNLKLLLELSLVNTNARVELYRKICEVVTGYEELEKDCESFLYSLVYFLSIEVHWLQREPLVFRDFRIMLSEIALRISTFDVVTMSSLFDKFNRSNTTSHKLAIRYKYCAVTLLRSSNKLLFCQSLSAILRSSYWNDTLSNNICQNAFYHLASLYKNSYNKSEKYFEQIQKEIQKIKKSKIRLTLNQELALLWIDAMNEDTLKSIRLKNLDTDLKILKHFKQEFSTEYSDNHPYPIESMSRIFLKRYVSYFNDYEISRENSDTLDALNLAVGQLKNNWNSIYSFINRIPFFHLDKLSVEFKESDFYRREYASSLSMELGRDKISRMTRLAYEIYEDPSTYNRNEAEYEELYKDIYFSYIMKAGIRGATRDSNLMMLASEFPTQIQLLINNVFGKEHFPKIRTTGNLNVNVFYPKTYFGINLDLVKNNIIGKKNKDLSLSDIELVVTTNSDNEGNCIIHIKYSGTDQYNGPANPNGSLQRWLKELKRFGGNLEYYPDDEGWFNLKLKLLIYDNGGNTGITD